MLCSQRHRSRTRNGRAPRPSLYGITRARAFSHRRSAIGVMDGVTFELQHPESVTNSLAQLHQWLEPQGRPEIGIAPGQFPCIRPVTNRLETGRARLGRRRPAGIVRRSEFRVRDESNCSAARGVLQISGAQAGRLVIETTPPWTNSLFGRFDTLNPFNQTNYNENRDISSPSLLLALGLTLPAQTARMLSIHQPGAGFPGGDQSRRRQYLLFQRGGRVPATRRAMCFTRPLAC